MRNRSLVLLLFLVSGATGLVYQVIWTRQLSLVFGVTIFAASAVLAAFMGGLALGSHLAGRWIDRLHNPVRVYALLEAGIGLSALLVLFGLPAIEPAYVALARLLEGNFLLFNLARVLLAGSLLLIPTTLMGGTVPAIGRYLVERREEVGFNVGLLYAVNTFGAVLGCVLTGFVLIPSFDLSHVIVATAAVNLAIGAVLLVLRVGDEPRPAPEVAEAETVVVPLGPSARLAVLVFSISGFVALGYEILWTRALVVYLHNSTYAFTVMLAVFLTGLIIGDIVFVRDYDRVERPLLWLGVVQLLTGVSVILAASSYATAPELTAAFLGVQTVESFGGAVSLMVARAAIVLLPTTVFLGMVFPLVARVVCREMSSLGRHLGVAYAANTGGAIAGALGTTFLLIPFLGMRGTLVLLVIVNLLLGAACLWRAVDPGPRRLAVVAAVVALALLPGAAIPERLFYDALQTDTWKLLFYEEGVTDTTGVWQHEQTGHRWITYGDMRGTAGTMTNPFNRREAHLVHLLRPAPRRSLHIGFGVGNSLAATVLHPEVEQVDCVELSPHVRDTASFFPTNEGVLEHPKMRLIIDDGRNFLMRNQVPYDVIFSDPPEIFTANVVNLYTVEFYRLAARSLADDGLMVQWIPRYTIGELELRMMLRSMQEVFPETSLWRHGTWRLDRGGPPELVAIGSMKPLKLDATELRERMSHPALQASLAQSNAETAGALLSMFIAGPETLREWTADVPPITDDRTFVDFYTPRQIYAGYGFSYIHQVFQGFQPVVSPNAISGLADHELSLSKLNIALQDPVASLFEPSPEAEAIAQEATELQATFARGLEEWERVLAEAKQASAQGAR